VLAPAVIDPPVLHRHKGRNQAVTILGSATRATLLTLLVLGMIPAHAQTQTTPKPAAPSDAEFRELQQRLDSLKKQIDELQAAKDTATQQGLMQQNWRGMQDYMGWMHGQWGAGSPWMVGPGMMGPGAASDARHSGAACRCPRA
jgi:hypothetical protein